MKFTTIIFVLIMANQSVFMAENLNESMAENIAENTDDKNTAALTQLTHYLSKLDSYEANFQQQLVSGQRRHMETTSGKFVMQRPNRFLWKIITPYEQTIIADGVNVWSIDVDLEQVTVVEIEKSMANSPIMLLTQNDSKIESIFSVTSIESKNQLERFLLKPLDSSANFEFVQLGFDEGILQLLELHDNLGQITIITMTNIRNNPIVDMNLFVYHEIADFDLIDSRTQGSSGE